MFVSVKSRENSRGEIFVRPLPVACAVSEIEALDWQSTECIVSGNHFRGLRLGHAV